MLMKNREFVEGTDPAIYIGHRVRRRRDSSIAYTKMFHAEYTLESRQQSKSLKTSNKSVAIRNAHALSQRLAEGTEAKPVKKVTIEELKDAYLKMQENRNRAPRTLEKYRDALKKFAAWWESHSGRSASTFTEADFWEYRSKLSKTMSPKTISVILILLKQLFKWGAGRGKLLRVNPIAEVMVPEPPPTPQPCFTPDQVRMLLEKAKPHQKPIFATLAYLGLRIGELVALRWEDVLFDRGENGVVHICRGGSNGTTKGKRNRVIPIHPELKPILQSLPRIASTVFTRPPSKRSGKVGLPLHDRHLLVCVKELCKECGFPNAEQYKLHTFRHAFASMCARSQVSSKYALRWMGHQNSEILDMYTTIYDDVAATAISTINYGGSTPQPVAAEAK
jgi:integrase